MRTKFMQAACVLVFLVFIFSSCTSQRKTVCAPEKSKSIKFKGFL